MKAYAGPDEWFADAENWQKPLIEKICAAITEATNFEQVIKYGNLFFLHNGQAILIRHEEERVILGFFRGKRMTAIEPRLKPSGKYDLANLVLREGDEVSDETVAKLAVEAVRLNDELGDPRQVSP